MAQGIKIPHSRIQYCTKKNQHYFSATKPLSNYESINMMTIGRIYLISMLLNVELNPSPSVRNHSVSWNSIWVLLLISQEVNGEEIVLLIGKDAHSNVTSMSLDVPDSSASTMPDGCGRNAGAHLNWMLKCYCRKYSILWTFLFNYF